MIEHPYCLTGRPEWDAGVCVTEPIGGSMAADALSDLLKTVRLTGAAYFEIVAREPWAVASPPRDLILPKILPDADHLIAYHVVTAGHCFATVADGEPIALEAGQVIVITNSDSHTMSSRP